MFPCSFGSIELIPAIETSSLEFCADKSSAVNTRKIYIFISIQLDMQFVSSPFKSKNKTGTCGSIPGGGSQDAGAPGIPDRGAGTRTAFLSSVSDWKMKISTGTNGYYGSLGTHYPLMN